MSNSTVLDTITTPPLTLPGRIGQATAVEQARAVAEVHASMLMAIQNPRSEAAALAAIKQSCSQTALAERAFFRFPRGGQTVSGETIHLARELARCWRNIDYGIKEMTRDDVAGQSEMLAYAWDMEANTRVTNTFIVPHMRDKKGKNGDRAPERLVDLRDIYENNTNNGARRVRECIFAVLPPYIVEQAKTWCANTLKDGGGVPLPQRVAQAIELFAGLGITLGQLETKQGRKSSEWIETDVAQLGVIFKSLQRGEVTRDEEFPSERVTAAEIKGQAATQPGDGA